MKGIEQILRDAASKYEFSSDEYVKYVVENTNSEYATRKELEEKKARIFALSEELEKMNAQVESGSEAQKTVDELKAQLEEYKKAEEERKSNLEKAQAKDKFEAEFKEALGEKKFANEFTKEQVTERAFELRLANPDMEASAILDAVTSGQSNVWANPQMEAKAQGIPSNDNSQAELGDFARLLFSQNKS